jgi:hypothetical protein
MEKRHNGLCCYGQKENPLTLGSFHWKELGAALRNTEYAARTKILRLRRRMTMGREGNPVTQSDV